MSGGLPEGSVDALERYVLEDEVLIIRRQIRFTGHPFVSLGHWLYQHEQQWHPRTQSDS